jgi:magnesium chelatase subunit D
MLVVLTDARANVARDGKGGRPGAERDALGAAAQIARQRLDAVLVDTSPRPNPFARTLAERMAARCIPLPVSSAGRVADAVRHAVHR